LAVVAANVWAEGAAKAPKPGDKRVNSKDGAALVFVPGGEFTMGSDTGEDHEKPAHKQRVEGFWMYTKEVTNGQYRKFLAAKPQWTPERIDRKLHDGHYLAHWKEQTSASKDDSYPVAFVPWYAAQAYAEWAGGRLPTEAEWEYAAQGGKWYPFGTATGMISGQLANYSSQGTKPVGSYRPNPFGLYDLAGNVWEWCSSLYKEYPYRANDGREDPNDSGARVLRGGSWDFVVPNFLSAAGRSRSGPSGCYLLNCGFRCVVRAGVP
jgi:formylglycine-generating enzyme required for sulfatase activity